MELFDDSSRKKQKPSGSPGAATAVALSTPRRFCWALQAHSEEAQAAPLVADHHLKILALSEPETLASNPALSAASPGAGKGSSPIPGRFSDACVLVPYPQFLQRTLATVWSTVLVTRPSLSSSLEGAGAAFGSLDQRGAGLVGITPDEC